MKRFTLLVLASCGAAPASPPASTPRARMPDRPQVTRELPPAKAVRVARPDIRGASRAAAIPNPDPSDHLRWPLTANSHPTLEPAYAIAPVFAAGGVSWTDLCRRGAQNRRTSGALTEQTEYLNAWCDVERRETAAALSRLGALMRSTVLGMPGAVRLDIANILVDAGDADQAQRLLAAAKITDIAVIDTVAASYIEVGRVRDGALLNEIAIGSYDFKRPADQCERLTRRLLLAHASERAGMIDDFDPYLTDRSCVLLAHQTSCWAFDTCSLYLGDHGFAGSEVRVLKLYLSWPETAAKADTWWSIGENAFSVMGAPGADELAVAAYEGVLRSDSCERDPTHDVRLRALSIRQNTLHILTLDKRLDAIIDAPRSLCGTP